MHDIESHLKGQAWQKPSSQSITIYNCRYAGLLRYAVDPSGAGKGLFFSYGADLTLTQQRRDVIAKDDSLRNASLADRADGRFFFNRQLTQRLKGLSVSQACKHLVCTIMLWAENSKLPFVGRGAYLLTSPCFNFDIAFRYWRWLHYP